MVHPIVNQIQNWIIELIGTGLLLWFVFKIVTEGTTNGRLAGLVIALAMMGYKWILNAFSGG